MGGRRVFISYQHDDIMQARGFNLLQWNPNVPIEFVGRHLLSPVESENEQYIKSKIREHLNGTSVTVVLIGRNTAESPWVDFEIRESVARHNGVVGIRVKDVPDGDIPPALREIGAKTIDWRPDGFADEVEVAALVAGRPELSPPAESSSGSAAASSSAGASSCVR